MSAPQAEGRRRNSGSSVSPQGKTVMTTADFSGHEEEENKGRHTKGQNGVDFCEKEENGCVDGVMYESEEGAHRCRRWNGKETADCKVVLDNIGW